MEKIKYSDLEVGSLYTITDGTDTVDETSSRFPLFLVDKGTQTEIKLHFNQPFMILSKTACDPRSNRLIEGDVYFKVLHKKGIYTMYMDKYYAPHLIKMG